MESVRVACSTEPGNSETAQAAPTEAAFRKLAQDSHRLWATLEIRHAKPDRGTVHAWLRAHRFFDSEPLTTRCLWRTKDQASLARVGR